MIQPIAHTHNALDFAAAAAFSRWEGAQQSMRCEPIQAPCKPRAAVHTSLAVALLAAAPSPSGRSKGMYNNTRCAYAPHFRTLSLLSHIMTVLYSNVLALGNPPHGKLVSSQGSSTAHAQLASYAVTPPRTPSRHTSNGHIGANSPALPSW